MHGHPTCAPLRASRSHPAPTFSAPLFSTLNRLPEPPVTPSTTALSQHVLTRCPQHHHAPRRFLSPWIWSVEKTAARGMEPPTEAPLRLACRPLRLPLSPVSRPPNLPSRWRAARRGFLSHRSTHALAVLVALECRGTWLRLVLVPAQ
ncbi:hypothetical protein U9M48_027463 [Paspalum notatum var. saurae]|uniref:Uncharacterized protein n=1 Tax=Paspalum notatum var. saurae TaxID=547442 RepID=A0AAQ3X036_PASNO